MNIQQLIEANLQQLKNKQQSIVRLFPDFFTNPIKVPGIISKGGLRMIKASKDTWTFKVHSGSEDDKWYEVNIRWKNIVPEIQRAVADRRNWNKTKSKVDLKKVAAQVFSKADVELNCSCPADLYWGKHYIRSQDKYRAKYGEQENRPPDIRNPKQYGAYCKHIEALMKTLSFYKGTMANWIKKNYGTVIAKEEEKAAKKAGKYAAIGKALGKRKAKESIQEAVAALSDIELEVKNEYKDRLNKSLVPATNIGWNVDKEVGWLKFWLLTDGTVIPIKETHDELIINDYGVWGSLHDAGAISGYFDKFREELGVRGIDKHPTSQQTEKLKKLYREYHSKSLYLDMWDSFRSEIKSEDHLEYLLTYGKEETWESIKESMEDFEEEAKRIYGSNSELVSDPPDEDYPPGEWYRFWILTDGTIIPSPKSHIYVPLKLGTHVAHFIKIGMLRGLIVAGKDLDIHVYKNITEKQRESLLKLYSKFSVKKVYLDIEDDDKIFNFDVKSSEQLEYVLQYGPYEEVEESILNEAGKISPFGTEEEVQAVLDGRKTIVFLYQVSEETKKANRNPDLRSYVFDQHVIFFRKDKQEEGISRSKEVEKIVRNTNIAGFATREQMIRLGQLFDYSDEDIDVFLKRVGYEGLLKEDVSKISDPKLRKIFMDDKIEDLQSKISILNKLAKGMQKSLQLSMINSKIDAYEKEIANLKKNLGESRQLNEWEADFPEKEEWFEKRTKQHIYLVRKAANEIVRKYPEFKELIQRVQHHDETKFEEPERTPYVYLTWDKKIEKETGKKAKATPESLEATYHHVIHNAHHPEYYVKNREEIDFQKEDRDSLERAIDVSAMPDLAVAELVADWAAMSEELGTSLRGWYESKKDKRWKFSQHQEELIDKLLKLFKE